MQLPSKRRPTSPGEMLLEEFLKPMGITQGQLAQHLGWTTTKVNQIIRGKRAVTPETALALSDAFGNSPDFWLNLQRNCDLWDALQTHKRYKRLHQAS